MNAVADMPVIVIACHAWYGDMVGGSFKVATEQAVDLATRGYRVCYVCSSTEESPGPNVRNIDGVEVWTYPRPDAPSPSLANIRSHVSGTRASIEQIAESGNIVAIGGHTPLQFRGAIAAAKQLGCSNLIYHVHSPFHEELKAQWDTQRLSWKQQAALFLARRIEKHNLKHATLVQCFSEFTQHLLTDLCGKKLAEKTTVVPGWVDCQRFSLERSHSEEKPPSYWNAGKTTFFTLRRLESRMGIDTLCDAARILAESRSDFQVIIGGSGSQLELLRSRVTECNLQDIVQLPGRLEDSVVERAYALADCFVLPTKALECFGLIILEAWATNTPVISSRVGAIPELVQLQDGEWMFEAGNAQQLADRMAAFLNNELRSPENLRPLAENYNADKGLARLYDACYSQFNAKVVER